MMLCVLFWLKYHRIENFAIFPVVYNNIAFVQNLINGKGQKIGHGIKFTRSTINVRDVINNVDVFAKGNTF